MYTASFPGVEDGSLLVSFGVVDDVAIGGSDEDVVANCRAGAIN